MVWNHNLLGNLDSTVVVTMAGKRWCSANVWTWLGVSPVRRVRVPFRTSEPALPPGR
jgi:hypothetical protein